MEKSGEDKIFLARKFWVPDDKAKSCFNCNVNFLPPFRRRHHCRMCGKVFCSKCSDHFLRPPEFIFENEKEIRVCTHCFKLSQNIIQRLSHNEILINFGRTPRKKDSRKFTSPMQSFSHATAENPHYNLNVLLSYHLNLLIDDLTECFLKEMQLNESWNDLLKDLIIRALDDVQPDTVDSMDLMDITNYIKIKKIPYQDNSETKYIQGVAIRKNLAHKKMANEVLNPRILMISGSLDHKEDSHELTSLDTLVQEEQEQAQRIVKSILRVHPDIVIVEKNVNWKTQELLRQNEVTVIFKLKPTQFGRICRVTGSKYINNLRLLNDDPDGYIGQCALFKIMNLENHEHFEKAHKYEKGANFDPSIMKFDGCTPSKGITITVSGPDYDELKAVKAYLLNCFRIFRELVVKKEVILQEIFLYYTREEVKKALAKIKMQSQEKIEENDEILIYDEESKAPEVAQPSYKQYFGYNKSRAHFSGNSHLFNETSMRSAGFLMDFLDDTNPDAINLNSLKSKCAKFTKVNFVALRPEGDLQNLKKEEMLLLEKRLAENSAKKLDYLAQVCSVQTKINDFYSHNDTSLGDFIKKKAELLFAKCDACQRPRYHHTAFFYKNNSYVKVTTEAVGPASQMMKRELQKFQNEKKDFNGTRRQHRHTTAMKPNLPDPTELRKKASKPPEQNPHKKGSKLQIEGLSIEEIESSPNEKYQGNSNSQSNGQSPSHRDQSKRTQINMYLECNVCHKKVSDEFELSRVYLEYSVTQFLTQLVMSNEGKGLNDPVISETQTLDSPLLKVGQVPSQLSLTSIDSDPKSKHELNPCCKASAKSRVFKHHDILVKFTAATNKVYYPLELNHMDAITQSAIEAANQEQIRVKSLYYTSLMNSLMDFVLPPLTALIELIIKKYKLEVTPNEIIPPLEGSVNDQVIVLIRELLFIKQKLFQVKDDFKESISKCSNFLQIEEVRKQHFFKISKLCEEVHRAREIYFLPVKLEKPLQNERKNSFSVPVKKLESKASILKEDALTDNARSESSLSSFVSNEGHRASGSDFKAAPEDETDTSKYFKPIPTPERKNSRSQTPENSQRRDSSSEKLPALEEAKRNKSVFAQSNIRASGDQENLDSEWPNNTERKNSTASAGMKQSIITKRVKDMEDEKEIEIIRGMTRGLVCFDEPEDNEDIEKFDFIPVSETEPLSAIAYALNCTNYMKTIHIGHEFHLLEKKLKNSASDPELIAELRDKLLLPDARILKIKIRPHDQYFRGFRTVIGDLTKDLNSNGQNRQQAIEFLNNMSGFMDLGFQKNLSSARPIYPYLEKISFSKFKVIVYFPQQFQALRLLLGIHHADFIQSIACSSLWKDNSGGKTNAQFVKSHDDVYVFKALKKAELNAFISTLSNYYFEHMCKSLNPGSKKKTFLGRIVGIFEIKIKGTNTNYCYLAMENIGLGIKPTRVYDLKGSDLNRLKLHPEPGQVLLDTNFKLDQNGEPISIESSKMKEMAAALDNDTLFLSSLNRIDYSLLLVLDDVNQKYRIGILGYLQDYDLFKQGEYLMKSVFNNVAPTIVNAQEYRLRFMRCVEKYFMETFVEKEGSEKGNLFESEKKENFG